MNIPPFLIENKQTIYTALKLLFDQHKKTFNSVSTLGDEALEKLLTFMENGKFLRGGLVILSTKMYGGLVNKDVIELATAIEIVHSSLLIHDDIMDNDTIRRGGPTIFAQYEKKAKKMKYRNRKLYGQGMAICVGDIGFFFADKLITHMSCDSDTKIALIQFLSTELLNVGIAQMQDLEFASTSEIPTEEEILLMYKYKTGRYSFVLPLVLGALLAGKKRNELTQLEELGELFGILFQIKDDEIGIFSKDVISGKPQGSDIREGKKTLFYHYLFTKADMNQRKKIQKIFGNKDMTLSQLEEINNLISTLGIKEVAQKLINSMAQSIEVKIKKLQINSEYRQILLLLLDFNLNRDR
jgi:geranylgeranyl diphosphate synthase, type I